MVGLTTKEYQVLELLATRLGTPTTKEMFLSHLYGGTDEPGQKIIDVYICKLRKKPWRHPAGRTTSRPSGAEVTSSASRFP